MLSLAILYHFCREKLPLMSSLLPVEYESSKELYVGSC